MKRKILFFIPIILLISLSVYKKFTSKEISSEKNCIYFIGSSRVQRSIDPKIVNQLTNTKVCNLGISGSTFLHNIILAKSLIVNNKPKYLYIELSQIQNNFLIYHMNFENLKIHVSLLYQKNHFIENLLFFESFMHRLLNISNLNPRTQKSIKSLGFIKSSENFCKTTNSFLDESYLNKKNNKNISKHMFLIKKITALAYQKNVKIKFFLPLTYNSINEREIVAKVYNNLPKSLRVNYTKDFMNKITDTKNLLDRNHFNYEGAKIVSSFFEKEIMSNSKK